MPRKPAEPTIPVSDPYHPKTVAKQLLTALRPGGDVQLIEARGYDLQRGRFRGLDRSVPGHGWTGTQYLTFQIRAHDGSHYQLLVEILWDHGAKETYRGYSSTSDRGVYPHGERATLARLIRAIQLDLQSWLCPSGQSLQRSAPAPAPAPRGALRPARKPCYRCGQPSTTLNRSAQAVCAYHYDVERYGREWANCHHDRDRPCVICGQAPGRCHCIYSPTLGG
jgi:hypothetical protein